MTILSGCDPSGDGGLQINIPASCAQFEHTVADPIDDQARKAGDNAKAILAQYRAKLGIANKRIVAGRDCNADIRAQFARGK